MYVIIIIIIIIIIIMSEWAEKTFFSSFGDDHETVPYS